MPSKPMTSENLGDLLARVVAYGVATRSERPEEAGAALSAVMRLVDELGEGAGIDTGEIYEEFRKAKPRWVDED